LGFRKIPGLCGANKAQTSKIAFVGADSAFAKQRITKLDLGESDPSGLEPDIRTDCVVIGVSGDGIGLPLHQGPEFVTGTFTRV
jgi:hypothetical protein